MEPDIIWTLDGAKVSRCDVEERSAGVEPDQPWGIHGTKNKPTNNNNNNNKKSIKNM